MSYSARRELLCRVAGRYQMGDRKEKKAILDELTATPGYSRKYAIRQLNQAKRGPPVSVRRSRKRRYGPEVEKALVVVWKAANFICAKRLIPFIPELIPAIERHGYLCVNKETRDKLLSMSPATADRLLKKVRDAAKPKGISTTRPGSLLKHQVPVRTFADWQDSRPGFMEADLVAHCGSRTEGAYLNTLVLTDVATTWTECLPLLYRSEAEVLRALGCAREILPFQLLGLDTDNGSEFLNEGLIEYCKQEQITFTRGRAYKKNDQCYVEQKNGAIVRQLVGYDRFEGLLAYQQLGELYRVVRLYVNFFQPSMKRPKVKLASKVIARPKRMMEVLKKEEEKASETPEVKDEVSRQRKRRYRRSSKPRAPRTWRTRKDPFGGVSEELRQRLVSSPQCTAKSLLGELQGRYPERFSTGQLRTLQRRVKQWRRETLVKLDVEWLNVDSEYSAAGFPTMSGSWASSETLKPGAQEP